LVHIYRSYRQNKPGGPFFMEHPVCTSHLLCTHRIPHGTFSNFSQWREFKQNVVDTG